MSIPFCSKLVFILPVPTKTVWNHHCALREKENTSLLLFWKLEGARSLCKESTEF
jgi:hypothetical protein